jgi:hypothetical protein
MKTQESNGLARDAILPSRMRIAGLRKPLRVQPTSHGTTDETPRGDHRATSLEEFAGRRKL